MDIIDGDELDETPGNVAQLNRDMSSLPIMAQPGRITLKPLVYELKVLTKRRGVVRLGDVIKPPQELLLAEVEKQINESGQVRVIILKARQMGLSTMCEAILFVLSMMYRDFQSLVLSHEKESSEHILSITRRYWTTYVFQDYHTEQYAARGQLSWSDNQSNITVATANNKRTGRSRTLHGLHASEVAMWEGPEELMRGLRQAVVNLGISVIFLESTANGVGNWFHQTWLDAEANQSEYTPVFYAWFLDPEYDAQSIPIHRRDRYAELGELDAKEKVLRSMGVQDSRLLWRRWAWEALCGRSWDTFMQEYPSTSQEAFLTTGRNVFRLPDLLKHYLPMKATYGFLHRQGREVKFYESGEGDTRSWLKVYRFPAPDQNWGVYQIGADPTHTTVGDNACGQVVNRRTLEQCAVYSQHIDAVSFGDDLCLLGEWYNFAEIAPETTGPGFGTTGQMNGKGYPRIYERQRADDEHDTGSSKLGWISNEQTKEMAISYLINAISQELAVVGGITYGFVIHDAETYNEMKNYVTNEKGGYENGRGQPFDDTVMALGIAVTTHHFAVTLMPYQADTSGRDRAREVAAHLPRSLAPRTPTPSNPRPVAPSDIQFDKKLDQTVMLEDEIPELLTVQDTDRGY